MAIGAAIVSTVMSVSSARKQRKAGKMAQSAAEEGARGIEAETEMNIGQTKRMQAQTLGTAKANVAASGVRFDATKIAAVEFTEGGAKAPTAKTDASLMGGITAGVKSGKSDFMGGFISRISKAAQQRTETEAELEGGEQIAGAAEGGSIFTYLKEMKRNFAKDIAWQSKEGRSRARVTRMGGQVAKAQAYAGAMASIGSAASSFSKVGKAAGWWK